MRHTKDIHLFYSYATSLFLIFILIFLFCRMMYTCWWILSGFIFMLSFIVSAVFCCFCHLVSLPVCHHSSSCFVLRSLCLPTSPMVVSTSLRTHQPFPHSLTYSGCLRTRGRASPRPGKKGHKTNKVILPSASLQCRITREWNHIGCLSDKIFLPDTSKTLVCIFNEMWWIKERMHPSPL